MDLLKKFEKYKEVENYDTQREVIELINKYTQMYYPYNDCITMYNYVLNDLDIYNIITQLTVRNQVSDNDGFSKILLAFNQFIANNNGYHSPLIFDYFDGRCVFWNYMDFIHCLVQLYSSIEDDWVENVMMKVIEEIKLEE